MGESGSFMSNNIDLPKKLESDLSSGFVGREA
jgi:hypothetical protein